MPTLAMTPALSSWGSVRWWTTRTSSPRSGGCSPMPLCGGSSPTVCAHRWTIAARRGSPPHPCAAGRAVSAEDPQARSRSRSTGQSRSARAPAGWSRRRASATTTRSSARSRCAGVRRRPEPGRSSSSSTRRTSSRSRTRRSTGRTRSAPTPSTRRFSSPTISTTAPMRRSRRPVASWHRLLRHPVRPRGGRGPGGDRRPLYKVASGDITDRPLLDAVAKTGKPLLLSTGAATLEEIRRAIEWTGLGPERLVPLVCTLTYPTPDEDATSPGSRRSSASSPPTCAGSPTIPWGRRGLG